jgi:hypothetical protein
VTVNELLTRSMQLVGAVATGETLTAAEANDGLLSLNDMLEHWSTEGLTIPQIIREEFTLVPGQAAYTIGPSGNFNTAAPTEIREARIIDVSAVPQMELPIEIINYQQWADIQQKGIQSSQPIYLFFQKSAPLSTINLYYVPSVANKIALYSFKPLTRFTAVTDQIEFPAGYSRAIRYNLAVELAIEYGKEPSPNVMQMAMDAKAALMRQNSEPLYLQSDALIVNGGQNVFNILTGE